MCRKCMKIIDFSAMCDMMMVINCVMKGGGHRGQNDRGGGLQGFPGADAGLFSGVSC